jgi:hypothetical protein
MCTSSGPNSQPSKQQNKMEAVSSFETSVSIYQAVRRNISEDNTLLQVTEVNNTYPLYPRTPLYYDSRFRDM